MLIFLLFIFEYVTPKESPISVPYRIQGTVIFPNGTSIYADHEFSKAPEKVNEMLLFQGLFQLAGDVSLDAIILAESRELNIVRGTILFPDGRTIRAHRRIIVDEKKRKEGEKSTETIHNNEHYLRNGSLAAHVFSKSEIETIKMPLPPAVEQIKVNVESPETKNGNSYYLEKERLGAFVYSEGGEQEIRLASTQSSITARCRFTFTNLQGSRGQYWLLRSKPCGNLPRLTASLLDGTDIHYYGIPVLVDL